jgi:hypothetical protein
MDAGTVALSDLKPTAPQIFRSGRWLPDQCATTTLFSVGQDGLMGDRCDNRPEDFLLRDDVDP